MGLAQVTVAPFRLQRSLPSRHASERLVNEVFVQMLESPLIVLAMDDEMHVCSWVDSEAFDEVLSGRNSPIVTKVLITEFVHEVLTKVLKDAETLEKAKHQRSRRSE